MKAIYQGKLWRVAHDETMTPVGEDKPTIAVPYGDPSLIIDPTDGDLAELESHAPQAPDSSNLYVALFNGRNAADEDLEDWGFVGPVIGPVGVSFTYGCVKLHQPGWGDMEHLLLVEDLVKFDGKFYGDFEIFTADDPRLPLRIQESRLVGFVEFAAILKRDQDDENEKRENEPIRH